MGTEIVKCPACGGYHQVQDYDKDEIICMGSSTLKSRDKKKFQNMKDNANTELTDNPTCWNNIRFTTRIDERRETTVLNPQVVKNKGVLYHQKDYQW